MLIVKTVLCQFALAACTMTAENLLSNQFIEDWLSFYARIQLYCYRQKLLYNLKYIDMSVTPIKKFITLTEDVALLTEIFMGQKANLVEFKCFVKYFLMFLQPI